MSESTIWNFLKQKGLSDCGAAGLMGNLYAESGLKSTNLQNSYEKKLGLSDEDYTAQIDAGIYQDFVHDSAGYGLAQWTFWSRKQALLAFALSRGKSIGDLEMQLDFLWKELTESYSSLVNLLRTATSVRAASDAVLVQFERPADQSEMAKARRASYGQKYYDQYAGKGETIMTPEDRVVTTALSEIGYIEKETNSQLDSPSANPGDWNWNKYARDLDSFGVVYNGRKNGYAWCDIFVDWCFITTFGLEVGMALLCQAKKGLGAGCTYSAQYYQAKGQFHTSNPKRGDQIFFTNDGGKTSYHTGLVTGVKNGRVYTVEGNTSSAAGVVPNGGCVRDKSYPLGATYIYGYGRPDYSIVQDCGETDIPDTSGGTYTVVAGDTLSLIGSRLGVVWQDIAKANGIVAPYTIYTGQVLVIPVKEEDDMLTYEQWREYMDQYRRELQDNDCGDWSKEAREWAIRVGLFAGSGTASDGQPNYMWQDQLTREQAAMLFYRFATERGLA